MADEEKDDVYSEKGREDLVENDEISPEEEGFMEGAQGDGQGAKCRKCGKVLMDDFVEKKVGDEIYRFCCDECALKHAKEEES